MGTRGQIAFGKTFLTTDMGDAFDEYERACRHRSFSEKTIAVYREAAIQLEYYLVNRPDVDGGGTPLPTEVHRITEGQIYGFLTWTKSRGVSSATYHNRFRSLKTFFNYYVKSGELPTSPMGRMQAPTLEKRIVANLSRDHVKALVDIAEGPGKRKPRNARDAAILWMFLDTPGRLHEISVLRVADVDIANAQVRVIGKGNKERVMNLGPRSVQAMERYLRVRDRLPGAAGTDMLWLGTGGGRTGSGPLKDSGVVNVIRRLCRHAGIPRVHPHQFRHTFAVEYLFRGGNETVLMTEAGWASNVMIKEYTEAAAARLAKQEYQRVNVTAGL